MEGLNLMFWFTSQIFSISISFFLCGIGQGDLYLVVAQSTAGKMAAV